MSQPFYQPPKNRLFLETCAVIREMRQNNLSRGSAEARLYATVVDGADLALEMIGKERMMRFVSEHIREVEQRDFDGGGIGLRPVTKTGGNAVADEMGQSENDYRDDRTPSSAPQSQTPAEMPVGGGHVVCEDQTFAASPSPSSGNAHFTTVRQHPRRLPSAPIDTPRPPAAGVWSPSNIVPTTRGEPKVKVPYVAPKERVSAQAQLRTKNIVAASILDTMIVRGRAIGEWRKEEALELAEKLDWDGKVLKAFADRLPPGALVKEYITVREAEEIMKTLEANRAA